MTGYVYILRYNNWGIGIWKIGSTKNIDNRLKAYVTSNGSLPDTVLMKSCDLFKNEESSYHNKFKLKRCTGQREHFILQNVDIEQCLFDNFKQYIGEVDINSVEDDLELLQVEMSKKIECIKHNLLNSLEEVQKRTNELIHNLRSEYNNKLNTILKKKELEQSLIEHEILKQQKIKEKVNENTFYKFLLENTIYQKDNIITIEELRNSFGEWIGKKIHKLDLGTIKQVNSEFEIVKINVCKKCGNEHKKGCCESYDRKGRTTKCIIKNIKFTCL